MRKEGTTSRISRGNMLFALQDMDEDFSEVPEMQPGREENDIVRRCRDKSATVVQSQDRGGQVSSAVPGRAIQAQRNSATIKEFQGNLGQSNKNMSSAKRVPPMIWGQNWWKQFKGR